MRNAGENTPLHCRRASILRQHFAKTERRVLKHQTVEESEIGLDTVSNFVQTDIFIGGM